jgi:hypothetical protein
MLRKFLVVAGVCSMVVVMAGSALAGGWAVSTVDSAPDEYEAGVEYDIAYTVLQHGRTPIEGETALVFSDGGPDLLRFIGTPTKAPGSYLAEVELPGAGTWTLQVDQGPFGMADIGTFEAIATVPTGLYIQAVLLALVAVSLLAATVLAVRSRQTVSPSSAPASRMTSRT